MKLTRACLRTNIGIISIHSNNLPHSSTNEMYKSRGWVWNDPEVIPIEPDNNLYYLIEKISKLLAGSKTLFLIDDIITDEALDKHYQPCARSKFWGVVRVGGQGWG